MAQTRVATEGVGLAPLTGLANLFPLGYLKKIPGVDVAIGVTAYQLAETAKRITKEAARGRNFSNKVARSLERGLLQIWKNEEDLPSRATKLAENAARGAMQAAAESSKDTLSFILPMESGIVKALNRIGANPEDTIRGISQGIIKGADDTGVDLNLAINVTVKSAREVVQQLGLDEHEFAAEAAWAAISAAYALDPGVRIHLDEPLSSVIVPRPKSYKYFNSDKIKDENSAYIDEKTNPEAF
jgi:hypothetical protein